MPNPGRFPIAASVLRVVTKSYAISVGCTSRPKRTPSLSKTSMIGFQRAAQAHAFGIAVTPHVGGQDAFVPAIDRVANSLADQVIRDRPAVEAVALEDLPTSLDITWVRQGLVDLEVVTPAGELQPVESPGGRLARQRVESQIGPLAGEQSHRTSHPRTSSSAVT